MQYIEQTVKPCTENENKLHSLKHFLPAPSERSTLGNKNCKMFKVGQINNY